MFIQTEATPNPSTLKFLPGRSVLPSGALEFKAPKEAQSSPLATDLFKIEGVTSVMFGDDFVSVTKSDVEWQHLKPFILGVLMEHLSSGAPLLLGSSTPDQEEFFDHEDADAVAAIKELIETRVRPNVLSDGGDITFRGFKEGTVYVAMKGACSGCPSSTATLKHGIENLLRHYVPEVSRVEQI
jgi:Fe-S cluster biogenesis protein NfuA